MCVCVCVCVCVYPLRVEPSSHSSLIPPLWVITEHQAELPVLDSSFLLAIRFTHGGVHMSVLLSQFIPPSPSPSVSTSPFSICPGAFSLDYSLFRFSSNTVTWGLKLKVHEKL